MSQPTLKVQKYKHPVSLYLLFFTELWERFSYYGMKSILILFLTSSSLSSNPGWNWNYSNAIMLLSYYTFSVYLLSIVGGLCSVYLFNPRIMVMIGAFLLFLGHISLIFKTQFFFYTGLFLIILGVGALKPNISTLVGSLYKKSDKNREIGFSIFYIGINIGSLLGMLIIGFIGELYDWHLGFGMAGLGMFIGLLTYIIGHKYIIKDIKYDDKQVISYTFSSIKKLKNIKYILLSYLIIIIFFMAFEQASGLLTIYANEKINRHIFFYEILYILLVINFICIVYCFFRKKCNILLTMLLVFIFLIYMLFNCNYLLIIPASWFQASNALFILILGIPIAKFWLWWNKNESYLFKMNTGLLIIGVSYLFMALAASQYNQCGYSSMYYLIISYLLQTIGELCLSPVALSFISRSVPDKYVSLMMGIFFAVTGFGGLIAGFVGSLISSYKELDIFLYIALICIIASFIYNILIKILEKNETSH
ncbi:MAG: peptide MFS transporter [Bacteroides sp.]|nr:MAG: peptide MFS transporter [Bacteroides sp.]